MAGVITESQRRKKANPGCCSSKASIELEMGRTEEEGGLNYFILWIFPLGKVADRKIRILWGYLVQIKGSVDWLIDSVD